MKKIAKNKKPILIYIIIGILCLYGLVLTWLYKETEIESEYTIKRWQESFATARKDLNPQTVTENYYCKQTNEVKSLHDYVQQQNEIVAKFATSNLSVEVINQIGNYAVITQHALPEGSGGWGIVRKDSTGWKKVFMSQDEVFCNLNKKYDLPAGLLQNCVD